MREDCLEKKRSVRKEISTLRDRLTNEELIIKSRCIKDQLLVQPEFIKSQRIFCYLSFRSEVKTLDIIKESLKLGKKVCVPVIDTLSLSMIASEILDINNTLTEGYYGIPEPKKDYVKEVPIREIDLVLLPGLAFDERGFRLGYGKGFYDKFLKNNTLEIHLIGLAYESQIVKLLPVDLMDVPVDKVITEERVIYAPRMK
ncbi:MAG: 5-formyltetrahydrofolate cyclo-ligase [bacterium]